LEIDVIGSPPQSEWEGQVKARYTRLYAGEGGISRFADIDVELNAKYTAPPVEPTQSAPFLPTEGCFWLGVPKGWNGETPHPTPRRQVFITVQGEYQMTAGDGETRRFPAGSVLVLEDTTGSGHSTKITSAGDVLLFCVGLPPQ
jgi:uncharacterized cupin superfamily protein